MTRIHEALTKAAHDHSAAHTTDSPFHLDSPQLAESRSAAPTRAEARICVNVVDRHATDTLELEDLRKGCSSPKWSLDPAVNIFSSLGLNAVGAEQFRSLRSRLCQLRASQPLRTILITSALAGEGKTFVTFNLAQAIVQQRDQRVLIIDADLRSSRLHRLLGAPHTPGLSEYLEGKADEIAVMQSSQDGNLYLVPGGAQVANPSELLANGRLKRLIDCMAPLFDWVIVDSPPCLPVTDANVAADCCDALLLVVKAYSTPAEIAQRAKEELRGKNVLGVVFNSVSEKLLTYGSYYSYAGNGNGQIKNPTE
jgi:protein-tyrosine kinase